MFFWDIDGEGIYTNLPVASLSILGLEILLQLSDSIRLAALLSLLGLSLFLGLGGLLGLGRLFGFAVPPASGRLERS